MQSVWLRQRDIPSHAVPASYRWTCSENTENVGILARLLGWIFPNRHFSVAVWKPYSGKPEHAKTDACSSSVATTKHLKHMFGVIVSKSLSSYCGAQRFLVIKKLLRGTRHSELFVICSIQMKKRCRSLKPVVERRSPLRNPDMSTFFFQIYMKLARCCRVLRDAFIDDAHVHCGNTEIDNRVPKSPLFSAQRAFSSKMVDRMNRYSSKRILMGK